MDFSITIQVDAIQLVIIFLQIVYVLRPKEH